MATVYVLIQERPGRPAAVLGVYRDRDVALLTAVNRAVDYLAAEFAAVADAPADPILARNRTVRLHKDAQRQVDDALAAGAPYFTGQPYCGFSIHPAPDDED